MIRLLVMLIRAYQRLVSPYLLPRCRFYPSCSEYTAQALSTYGWRGLKLVVFRLGRCHPLHPGGYDPLPGGDREVNT